MNFRVKLPYLISTIVIVICSSYFLSKNIPFTGDEFYTLDIEKIHKPLPYKGIVSHIIEILNPITPDNIFSLRFTSIFFTLLTIILWFTSFIKHKYEIIIFSIIIITSSFLLSETIYLRYYSYYFFTSTFTFIILTNWLNNCTTNQKLFYSCLGIIASPYFFYVLNVLQFAFYFTYTFLFEKISNSKTRLIFVAVSGLFIMYVIFNPTAIWSLLNLINISSHGNVDLDYQYIRGFNKSIMIKPFYSIYQMIFGYDIAPTESIIIIIIFLIVFICLIHILYLIFINNRLTFIFYCFTSIIPCLFIYYFFEVISLPGFTQLETKHGMLIYPLLIALIVRTPKYTSPLVTNIFLGFVFVGQLIGMYNTFDNKHTDWNLIIEKVDEFINNGKNGKIIMDGRSRAVFQFYNQQVNSNVPVSYTWEPMDSLESSIKDKERLILLLNDYKSYTPLTLEQNWNAGYGSMDRVQKLNLILKKLNKDYFLIDSYINYPTFLYLLEKKDNLNDDILSTSVWQHHLKDLSLPITKELNREIISSLLLQPGDSAQFYIQSSLVCNLEKSSGNDSIGDTVGIVNYNSIETPLIKGINIWDLFADFNGEKIDDSKIFHSWYHTPLVSGSIKYVGSYSKHKAQIYFLKINNKDKSIIKIINRSNHSGIRVWIKKSGSTI